MHLGMLVQMAADGMGGRKVVGPLDSASSMAKLADRSARAGTYLASRPGERVVFIDVNSLAVPVALFGAALAGKPFVPINYRLADDQLRALVARTAPATAIIGDGIAQRLGSIEGIEPIDRTTFLAHTQDPTIEPADPYAGDPDGIAVLLYTSGTTGEPKAAVLRHQNLASYVISTVEFAGADESDATLVWVPPYHAGISAVLSSTYAGRRIVYLDAFDPETWVSTARREHITHAMVVPTMLNRILDVIERDASGLSDLRALSYGGGPMPLPVIQRAMALLPGVDFVNAYGLTETSSTIALLGPDDHRAAFASADPAVRGRLASVGRPLPNVEVTIRDPSGGEVPTGESGEVWVRGEQVSGEYLGTDADRDAGWFKTRDAGHLDDGGYLYVSGRLDDVIVRGGENISPGEIEDVLLTHPAVDSVAVFGIPDTEWGEKVVAVVVPVDGADPDESELKDHVRSRLRSTRTPQHIVMRPMLPFNETGKLLRRALRAEYAGTFGDEQV